MRAKTLTQRQTMSSAIFKGAAAADTTALLHELAASVCAEKNKASTRLSFLSAFTLVYEITLHTNMKVLATKMMFFKRLSGMWTVRQTERFAFCRLAD